MVMEEQFSFFCAGSPAPGGSKNAFPIYVKGNLLLKNGRPVIRMVDAGGKANEIWKRDVAIQAKSFMAGRKPFTGALKVEFVFRIRRPQYHYRSGKFAALLAGDAPLYHCQAPDALKYARATEDACNGIVWVDDSQTIHVSSEKRWCEPGEQSGCMIRLFVLEPQLTETPKAETAQLL